MNAEQAEMITGVLFAGFTQRPVGEETAALYQRMILDLPADLAEAAVLNLISERDWLPSIAQIRHAVLDLTDDTPLAGDAWAEVTHCIRHYGHSCAPDWSHPLIGRTIKAIGGWYNLCMSEMPGADRARFIDVYNVYRERHRHNLARTPESRQLEAGARARLTAGGRD